MRRVVVESKIYDLSEPREVTSRYTGATLKVADVTTSDETGMIKLVLWNEQFEQVNAGHPVKVENGYIKSVQGKIHLNVGTSGKLAVL